jgi:hypothetical protein
MSDDDDNDNNNNVLLKIEQSMVPFFQATRADNGTAVFGPFAALPDALQRTALDLLYYVLSGRVEPLLRAVAACLAPAARPQRLASRATLGYALTIVERRSDVLAPTLRSSVALSLLRGQCAPPAGDGVGLASIERVARRIDVCRHMARSFVLHDELVPLLRPLLAQWLAPANNTHDDHDDAPPSAATVDDAECALLLLAYALPNNFLLDNNDSDDEWLRRVASSLDVQLTAHATLDDQTICASLLQLYAPLLSLKINLDDDNNDNDDNDDDDDDNNSVWCLTLQLATQRALRNSSSNDATLCSPTAAAALHNVELLARRWLTTHREQATWLPSSAAASIRSLTEAFGADAQSLHELVRYN